MIKPKKPNFDINGGNFVPVLTKVREVTREKLEGGQWIHRGFDFVYNEFTPSAELWSQLQNDPQFVTTGRTSYSHSRVGVWDDDLSDPDEETREVTRFVYEYDNGRWPCLAITREEAMALFGDRSFGYGWSEPLWLVEAFQEADDDEVVA